MPKRGHMKCYFECDNDGPFHRFPNARSAVASQIERYHAWKSILGAELQNKDDKYIYESVRLCNKHFVDGVILPSNRLTLNAVPTLGLAKQRRILCNLNCDPPSCALKIVVDIIGVQFEEQKNDFNNFDKKPPEYYNELNSLDNGPTMVDRDIVLSDSDTILKYLLTKYGDQCSENLYPSDINSRIMIDQVLSINSRVFFTRLKAVILGTLFEDLPEPTQQHLKDIERVYFTLETYLQKHQYIATDSLTVADIAVGCNTLTLAGIHPIDKHKFPRVELWLNTLKEHPNIKSHGVTGTGQLISQLNSRWKRNKIATSSNSVSDPNKESSILDPNKESSITDPNAKNKIMMEIKGAN